jgi:hypothetical protein
MLETYESLIFQAFCDTAGMMRDPLGLHFSRDCRFRASFSDFSLNISHVLPLEASFSDVGIGSRQ